MRQIRAEYPNNLLYKYYFLYHFNEKSTKSEPPLPPYTVLHDKDVHTCLFKKVVTITKICEGSPSTNMLTDLNKYIWSIIEDVQYLDFQEFSSKSLRGDTIDFCTTCNQV